MPREDFDNTNRGALFVNDKKESENHPDWNGKIDVEGTEYWVSAWKKRSKSGDPYLSLSIKPKEQKRAAPTNQRKASPPPADDFDDQIPW